MTILKDNNSTTRLGLEFLRERAIRIVLYDFMMTGFPETEKLDMQCSSKLLEIAERNLKILEDSITKTLQYIWSTSLYKRDTFNDRIPYAVLTIEGKNLYIEVFSKPR